MGVPERSPDLDRQPAVPERPRLPILAFGPFAFDTHSRLLSRDGVEVPLPPRVLGVLELLLRRAGDVVPRQDLIDTVWKDAFVTDTSLAEAISVLRQVLGDDPQAPTYIQTLHRRGYRFVAPLTAGEKPSLLAREPAAPEVPGELPVSPSIANALVPWSAAAICAVIAIAAVWQATRRTDVQAPAPRFVVAPADGTSFDRSAPAVAISPDGARLAWSACDRGGCRLYQRPIDRLEVSAVAGTDDARAPFFSPDGKWIGFFAGGRLKKVSLDGGAPIALADAPSMLGGTWGEHDIIFAGGASGGLMRVAASGGEPRRLTTPRETEGEVRHAWPSLLPGRKVLLFTILTGPEDDALGLLAAVSLDGTSSEAKAWRTLADGIDTARPAGNETIVFSRGSELHAVRFDPVRLTLAGAPRAVLDAAGASRGAVHYALSASGALVHLSTAVPSERPAGGGDRDLGWWSPEGTRPASVEIRRFRGAAISPDGRRLAGLSEEGIRSDLWVADVQRGAATRMTHGGFNASPVWSPDGRSVYFSARTSGAFDIWVRDADANLPATRILSAGRHAFPLAASPDGKMLAFARTADGTAADIWLLPLPAGEPRPFVEGPFEERAGSFSPDSRLLAFQSSETGRWEIYVQCVADGRRVLVSTDGGERPIWRSDGLYFQSNGSVIRAAVSDNGRNLTVGPNLPVADIDDDRLRGIAPDGLYLVEGSGSRSRSTAVVTIDWLRKLDTLLGPAQAALPR